MLIKAWHFMTISWLAAQISCSAPQPAAPGAASKPVPVTVIAARYQPTPDIVEAPGSVQPRNRIALSAQINGFVRDMKVRVGDLVRADQLVATLDARDAESQRAASQGAIDEAQAALGEARQQYRSASEMRVAAKASADLASQTLNRYQRLFEARSVSPQELDEMRARRDATQAELAARESMMAASQERIRQIEARVAQAKAQSGRADVMMSWTEIKAPAAGRIVERSADSGTAIFPGSPLLVIESTERPQVLADIPTEHAANLHGGMEVLLRTAGIDEAIRGRVVEIVPISDVASHTTRFKVDFSPGVPLANGQFVKVEVPVGIRDRLLVPRRAVRETGQITGLFLPDASSRARLRLVKVAPFNSESFELLSGVEAGETIIAGLTDQITDGTAVEIR